MARTMTIAVVSLLVAAVAPADGQDGQDGNECGDRASLRVVVLDESGTVALPGATVVLRWNEARRRPVREAADPQGRFFLCVPRDAQEATLWAEFGDGSSE